MSKSFFEVFPSLKLERSVHDIMEQTSVERISTTKNRDFLRIYLQSPRLILKNDIWMAERQIKKQFFPQNNLNVKIYERFELSAQYTPQKLLDIYRDSILAELKEYSHIVFHSFKSAEITYPEEGVVLLTMKDNVLTKDMEAELIRILEKILVERCGFLVKVRTAYKQVKQEQEEESLEGLFRAAVQSGTQPRGEEADYLEAQASDASFWEQESRQEREARPRESRPESGELPQGGRTGAWDRAQGEAFSDQEGALKGNGSGLETGNGARFSGKPEPGEKKKTSLSSHRQPPSMGNDAGLRITREPPNLASCS